MNSMPRRPPLRTHRAYTRIQYMHFWLYSCCLFLGAIFSQWWRFLTRVSLWGCWHYFSASYYLLSRCSRFLLFFTVLRPHKNYEMLCRSVVSFRLVLSVRFGNNERYTPIDDVNIRFPAGSSAGFPCAKRRRCCLKMLQDVAGWHFTPSSDRFSAVISVPTSSRLYQTSSSIFPSDFLLTKATKWQILECHL